MLYYDDPGSFTEDARRRNRLVKDANTPLSARLWWRVEQVIRLEDGRVLVLWSRPEPLSTH